MMIAEEDNHQLNVTVSIYARYAQAKQKTVYTN